VPGSASRPGWAVDHGSRVCHSRLARTLALANTPGEQAEYPTSRGCRFPTKQARSYGAPRRSLLVRRDSPRGAFPDARIRWESGSGVP
jgi:hypothetical protein